MAANFTPNLGFNKLWPVIAIIWGIGVSVSGLFPPVKFSRLMNGVFIGIVGFILLNNTLGYVPFSFWLDLISLWPVFLIMAGVSILGGVLGSRFISALPSLILVGVLLIAFLYHNLLFQDRTPQDYKYSHETVSGIDKGLLSVQIVAGKMTFGATEKLYEVGGSTIGAKDKYPRVDFFRSGSEARLNISPYKGFTSFNITRDRDWAVLLSRDVEWEIESDACIANVEMDLSSLKVRHLSLDCGIGHTEVRFGDRLDRVSGVFEAGLSSLHISVPKNSGVRLNMEQGLSSKNFLNIDLRPVREDRKSIYETPGFSGASKQIELNIDAGISSVTIEGY
ncbi:MAG: hypothetical protein HY779_04725 [Rubrobacteridae bacterium]|nr:hypothetical protein [Rubrobacteridae bacterium]